MFLAQRGSKWVLIIREEGDRRHFHLIRLPPYDDEEPPLDYGNNVPDIEAQDTIQIDIENNKNDDNYPFQAGSMTISLSLEIGTKMDPSH